MLKAAGLIRGPVNAWPLPWAQIDQAFIAAGNRSLPPHLAAALRRVRVLSERASQGTRYEVRAAAASDPALVRDFGTTAREDMDASARVEHNLGRLYVSYGVGFRDGQRGNDVHFEPAQVAYALGNWALYGGYVETWWGPGHDGALLFSNSTRPFPKIGIKRLSPEPFNLPVLRWFGPWRLDAFVGLLDEDREFDNPAVAGIRIAFEPVSGLEIGLNRAMQLCGKERPCDFETWTDALIGLGDADNTGTFDEPGNQLAGLDISYTRMIGQVSMQLYAEAEAEDEDNVLLIDQFGRMAGVNLTGPVGGEGANWQLTVEYADTYASKLFGGRRYPGSLYNNFIYTDGFTYRGRPIGYSIDGDGELMSVGGAYTDTNNRRFYGSLRAVKLNRTDLADRNRISANSESIKIATAGVEWPTQFGDIRLEGRLMDDAPNTPGRSPTKGQFELSWRTRF